MLMKLFCLCLAALPLAAAAEVRVSMFAEDDFTLPTTLTFEPASLAFQQPNRKLAWPAPGYKNRWSAVADCQLAVTVSGDYRFKFQGSSARAMFGGLPLDLMGTASVRLEPGKQPLRLFLKKRDDNDHQVAVDLKWLLPGAKDFTPVPVAGDTPSLPSIPFFPAPVLTERAQPNYREYAFDVANAGYYRLGAQGLRGSIGHVTFDGAPLFPLDSAFTTVKPGFWGEYAVRRWLEPGRHALRIHFYDTFGRPLAWRPFVQAVPPGGQVAVWVKNSSDMVFTLGEPMTFVLEQATATDTDYILEISAQRGAPVWSQTVSLPANPVRSVREVTYNCPKEGGFEWRLLGGGGETLAGPWQFVVVDPTPLGAPLPGSPETLRPCVLVDRVDCVDSGHAFRDNGSSRVVKNYRVSGSKHDYISYAKVDGKWRRAEKGIFCSDQDWFAYSLKVEHPGKPHRLTAWVPTDRARMVAVQVFDQVTGMSAGAVMDISHPTPGGDLAPLSCVLWPNGDAVDVTAFAAVKSQAEPLLNESAVVSFELYEYPEGLPALPVAASGWAPVREFGWVGEQLNLGVELRAMPKLFSDDRKIPGLSWSHGDIMGPFFDYQALFQAWSRFGEYCRWRGDNLYVLPVHSYNMTHIQSDFLPIGDEAFRGRPGVYAYRPVDLAPRDTLKLIALLGEKYGVGIVADFQMNHRLTADFVVGVEHAIGVDPTELPLIGRKGEVYGNPGAVLDPSHPLVRKYLKDMVGDIARRYAKSPGLLGVNFRHWTWTTPQAGWFVHADAGYGDGTIARFEKDSGLKVPVDSGDTDRFEKRYEFLVKNLDNREIWFKWRAGQVSSLKREMLAEARRFNPKFKLYAGYSQTMDYRSGNGLDDTLSPELGGGQPATAGANGTEINRLDPYTYANFDQREGVDTVVPEQRFENPLYFNYPYGLCSGHGSGVYNPPYQLEAFAKALAERQFLRALNGGPWVLPVMDEGIRNWVRAWRAIPVLDYQRLEDDGGAVCWHAADAEGKLVFYLVNPTAAPLTVRFVLDNAGTSILDMVSGERLRAPDATWLSLLPGQRQFQIELEPFGLRLLDAGRRTRFAGFRPAVMDKARTAWLFPASPWRCKLTVQAIPSPDGQALVVVRGRDLLCRLEERKVSATSLRVVADGKAIPVQVDGRDASGVYGGHPGGLLGPDDEIVFRAATTAAVQLYFGTEPLASAPASAFTVAEVAPSQALTAQLVVGNGLFEIGFCGDMGDGPKPGILDYMSKLYSSGCMSWLKRGDQVLWSAQGGCRGLPSGGYGPAGKPTLLVNGPVRCLVGFDYPDIKEVDWFLKPDWERWASNGHLLDVKPRRVFSVWADSPVVGLTDELRYSRAINQDFTSGWHYMSLQRFAGKPEDKLFHYSSRGEPRTREWGENGFNTGYENVDGWGAVWDAKAGVGLELVGEPLLNRFDFGKDGARMLYSSKSIPPDKLALRYHLVLLDKGAYSDALAWRDSLLAPPQVEVSAVERHTP